MAYMYIVSRSTHAALLLLLATTAFAEGPPGWVLTFSEDFDQKDLEFPKWSPHDPWGHERNRESQAWAPEALHVEAGTLHIVAKREKARFDGQERSYTSGIVTTYGSFAQTYGRFEIRC